MEGVITYTKVHMEEFLSVYGVTEYWYTFQVQKFIRCDIKLDLLSQNSSPEITYDDMTLTAKSISKTALPVWRQNCLAKRMLCAIN
jgi:hypothetical protein